MFRAGHVVLQYFGNTFAFQRDDALIRLIAVLGIQRDDETPVAHQFLQRTAQQIAFPLRSGTHFQVTRTFHYQQLHRALAMYLQDHGTLQFERRGKQYGCSAQLAHQIAQYGGIVMTFDHVLPDRVDTHNLAAYRGMLKQESTQGIRWIFHGR